MATVAASEHTALHCASFNVPRIEDERRDVAMIVATMNKAKCSQTPVDARLIQR